MQCEWFVKEILPNLRAEIVKVLIKKGMKKSIIAEKLRITKSAVTQYEKEMRGKSEDKKIKKYAQRIAKEIENEKDVLDLFCYACVKIGGNLNECKKNKNRFSNI